MLSQSWAAARVASAVSAWPARVGIGVVSADAGSRSKSITTTRPASEQSHGGCALHRRAKPLNDSSADDISDASRATGPAVVSVALLFAIALRWPGKRRA